VGCLPHFAAIAEEPFPCPSSGELGGTLTQNSVLSSLQWLTVAVGVVENFLPLLYSWCSGWGGELTTGGRGARGRENWSDSRWLLCKLTLRLVAVGWLVATFAVS
jgi:hypothetical protein